MLTLDTGNQNFSRGRLVDKLGSIGVDRSQLGTLDRTTLVDGVTGNVHNTTEGTGTDGNHDGVAGISDRASTRQTLGTFENPSVLKVSLHPTRKRFKKKKNVPSMAIHRTMFSPRC